jgi:putative oxidoreductase
VSEFALQAEQESEHGLFTTHVVTLAVAFFFFVFGFEKLLGAGHWVDLFRRLGLGEWFRYFTGAVQVTGAGLAVLRRTALVGVFLMACTMVGAVIANMVKLGGFADATFPGLFLIGTVAAGAIEIVDSRRRR